MGGGWHLLNNAFTLIELLAVIIILAIVALIATPIILDVVEDARISAGKSEAQMILGGINNYCASSEMKKQMGTLGSEDIDCSIKSSFTEEEIGKMLNLGNAKVISNSYSNGKVTGLVIKSNNHKFTLCSNGQFAMDGEECGGEVSLVGDPIIEKAKVGLITIDEYNLAGGSSSYLNIRQVQWTMTPCSSSDAWFVYESGGSTNNSVSYPFGLRAVINVNSGVTITGGNGTLGATWSSQAGPYILNEDKSVEVTGKLNEKATSGEYVLFAGKKYRVVDKDSNGNTKLILDGYYEEDGNILEMKYNEDETNEFSQTKGIGQKLNTDVLEWLVASSDTSNRNKLVGDYVWYQNNFDNGQSYTISLNEENPTRSISATIGLIRIGEMLSNQSSSILTNGYQDTSSYNNANRYWTMASNLSIFFAWYVTGNGDSFDNTVSVSNAGLRAVIVVNSDVTITGGNGTWSNPYQI